MLTGTTLAGIFVAYAASLLTRAQWVRMQGLRPIHRLDHIIVCGGGSVGTAVVDLLLEFDQPVVVIEQQPDTALVEQARDRGFDLLTGDASRDDTLDLCNLGAAHGLVALTNADTLNLEIALGARVRNPNMPIVLRIAEVSFATSIARHFQFETTFSVAALAGPVFAGLSERPGARGRIAFAEQEYAITEVVVPAGGASAVPCPAIPLAAATEDGKFRLIRDVATLRPGDCALLLVPRA
jgi:Trk K+ transport system NAD-binding subunit